MQHILCTQDSREYYVCDIYMTCCTVGNSTAAGHLPDQNFSEYWPIKGVTLIAESVSNQSLRPNVNSPNQLAPCGASYGADNQLAIAKLNRSNAVTMSSKKPYVWMVTLDTNSPHIYLGQVGLQVGQVSYWGELAVEQIDCKSVG